MSETEDFTQRIIELENRVAYMEKKFNINRNSPEVLFPMVANITTEEMNNGD